MPDNTINIIKISKNKSVALSNLCKKHAMEIMEPHVEFTIDILSFTNS